MYACASESVYDMQVPVIFVNDEQLLIWLAFHAVLKDILVKLYGGCIAALMNLAAYLNLCVKAK